MKKLFSIALILGTVSSALPTFASEMSVPGISIRKPSIQPTAKFPGKLKVAQFVSSVDGAPNSWRSTIVNQADGVRVVLKVGEWDRPDSLETDTVWIANHIDWATVDTRNRELEFTYTFAESTVGVQSIFKLGASPESVGKIDGDYSFALTYGAKDCTFRSGEESTSGQLPFKITTGTTVRVRVKANDTIDIWIDDQPILADQVLESKYNLVSMFATSDSPRDQKSLQLAAFEANLVRAQK